MYILIFYINKALFLSTLYKKDDYFKQSLIKTAYAAILCY